MIDTFDNLSKYEMLDIIGGFNGKAVVRTLAGTAVLVGSIAAGEPFTTVAACVEIGYNMTKIFDDDSGGDSKC